MVWKTIPGYPGYSANSEGHIRNEKTGHVSKGGNAGEYLKVSVYAKGAKKPSLCYVHDLVCRAFHGLPSKGQVVLHKDDNKKNCKPSNLKWGSQSENIKSAYDNGLISKEAKEPRSLTAVIIKGNPKFIKGNSLATEYYSEIKKHLNTLGIVDIVEDAGADFTRPPKADLYIGHSRGVSREEFIRNPRESIFVKLGVLDGIIEPEDAAWQKVTPPGTGTPPRSHYTYSANQKHAVENAVNVLRTRYSTESVIVPKDIRIVVIIGSQEASVVNPYIDVVNHLKELGVSDIKTIVTDGGPVSEADLYITHGRNIVRCQGGVVFDLGQIDKSGYTDDNRIRVEQLIKDIRFEVNGFVPQVPKLLSGW